MNPQQASITVVIVTYCSRGTIGEALDAQREAVDGGLARVVVVDNASTDDTAAFIEESYPWVTLIRSKENLGYGRGCNLGFEQATTPYVLICNPDAVVSASAMGSMLDFLERTPQAGIVAPAIREGGASLQDAGLMTTPGSLLRSALAMGDAYRQRRTIKPGEKPFRTDWVCGAVMLIRSELFRALGGFDPRFFLYFEETDLCRRASARGAELWALGEAVVDHVGGASAKATGESLERSCIAQHFYRSRFYYLIKHFGWVQAISVEALVAAVGLARALRDRVLGRGAAGQPRPRRPLFRLPAVPEDAA